MIGCDPVDELQMTVDEVARAAGTTTRNVRNYQTKGLLDPPTMVGRVGHYGRPHLSRLKLIARLQERGYSLAAIGDLLRAFQERQTVGEMLGLERELTARVPEEEEQILSRSQLVDRFPMLDGNLELVASVVDLELVVPLPPERRGRPEQYRVPSPKLLDIGGELLDAGVPIEVALEELERLRNDARRIAGRLVDMFTRHVWDPWVEAGHPVDAVPQMVERIRRLKPLPVAAMDSVLAHALDREIGRVVADKAGRAASHSFGRRRLRSTRVGGGRSPRVSLRVAGVGIPGPRAFFRNLRRTGSSTRGGGDGSNANVDRRRGGVTRMSDDGGTVVCPVMQSRDQGGLRGGGERVRGSIHRETERMSGTAPEWGHRVFSIAMRGRVVLRRPSRVGIVSPGLHQ